MINKNFWKEKKVFVTGHTGFKGSWLSLWLTSMGAKVTGYALNPPTVPSLFELCNIEKDLCSIIGDIRDANLLKKALKEANPEIVIHMAAQPIVRESYKNPIETYSTNVMGTVNLLDNARDIPSIKAILNITTDKCYENKEWLWGYRENDALGGFDPYSNSKSCSELVTASFRNSFFNPKEYSIHGVGLATARAGNVIGGGDWAQDRLIPDFIKAISEGKKLIIRYPNAVRPWQHVLEPLSGYLILAQKLYEDGSTYSEPWNFAPREENAKPVVWIADYLCSKWGNGASYAVDTNANLHETLSLRLDCSKAKERLKWTPRWSLDFSLDKVIDWFAAYNQKKGLKKVCLNQIEEYLNG